VRDTIVRWMILVTCKEDSTRDAHGGDPRKCLVSEVKSLGWLECLEKDAAKCPHSLSFGTGFLCRHPDQTKADPFKAKDNR
jgi:hypothetical protein